MEGVLLTALGASAVAAWGMTLWSSRGRSSVTCESLQRLGHELGLKHNPERMLATNAHGDGELRQVGVGRLSGSIEALPVQVKVSSVCTGVAPLHNIQSTVHLKPALTCPVHIQSEGALASLQKRAGAQDILVGDQPFDDHFLIQGEDEDAVKTLLTEDLRRRLLAFTRQHGEVTLTSTQIHFATQTLGGNIDDMRDAIEAQISLARMLTGRELITPTKPLPH